MKKAIPILFTVVFAGFALIWWKQASYLKNEISAFAKESNIEYETIQCKGFPLHFIAEIKNAKLVKGKEHFLGDITIGTNLFAKNGYVRIDGEMIGDISIKGNLTASTTNLLEIFEKRKSEEGVWKDWLKNLSISSDQLMISRNENILSEIENANLQWKFLNPEQNILAFEIYVGKITSASIFSDSDLKNSADFFCNGSFSLQDFSKDNKLFPFSIEINECRSKDLYSQNSFKGKFFMEDIGSEYHSHFCFSSDQQFLQPYPPINQDKFFTYMMPLLEKHPTIKLILQNNWDEFIQLVPNLTEFGSIKSDIDIECTGILTSTFQPTQINIQKLNYECDHYSIGVSGNLAVDLQAPQMEYKVHVNNHRELFSDLIHFYNRAQPLLRKTYGYLPEFNDKIGEKIALFLESFSQPISSKSLNLSVKFDETSRLTIGTKSYDQVLAQFTVLASEILAELNLLPSEVKVGETEEITEISP